MIDTSLNAWYDEVIKDEVLLRSVDAHEKVKRIDFKTPNGKYSLIVERLDSCRCIVIDLIYPDDYRSRIENINYD